MKSLVSKLSKERKQHIDHIENMTFRNLKISVSSSAQLTLQQRPNYVPRMRTKEELRDDVKYKKSWKGSGSENGYFMEPPIMKPKVLDPWTMSRVQMPERGYEKYFFSRCEILLISFRGASALGTAKGARTRVWRAKHQEGYERAHGGVPG